ncbi:hypothetical protein pb186bvf_009852 [Paramecium bursaria]
MIIPYKQIGLDLSNVKPFLNNSLIIAQKYTYRIYQLPELKTKIDGLIFDHKIRSIYSQNEFIYVAVQNKLYTIKHNVLDINEYDSKIKQILIYYPIKIVATENKLYINDQIIPINVQGMFHLPTYLNKIVIYDRQFIKLINIITHNEILSVDFQRQYSEIQIVKPTPALDIIAIGTLDLLILYNIQSQQAVAEYRLTGMIKDIAFNTIGKNPLMAVVQNNVINLYNLNTKEMIYQYQSQADWIFFYGESYFYIGSSIQNNIQQLSIDEFKMMLLVRQRTGFKESINYTRFYGLPDETQINVLLGSQKQIRYQSIINENLIHDKIQQNSNISFSIVRENDWANILSHDGTQIKFHNTYTDVKTNYRSTEQIHQVQVTFCGNYGFIAHSRNIQKITMQSGSLVLNYPLQSTFNKMYVDPLNQYLIVFQDGILQQFDFISGKQQKQQIIDNKVLCLVGSKSANILCLGLDNNQIEVIDYSTLKTIRNYKGHNLKIFDLALTLDNQYLVSVSLDKTLKIWSLVFGNLIQQITFPKPLISIDVSDEYLIGSFMNSRSLSVWKSKLSDNFYISKAQKNVEQQFHSDLTIKSKDMRQYIYSKTSHKMELEQVNHIQIQQQSDDLIKFTTLPDGKWVPIQYIDKIRERNRVKLADADVKIPFFMDFRNADQEKQNLLDEIKTNLREKSKIIKKQRDQYLAELQSDFEKCLNNEDIKIFDVMKQLNPTSYDYELNSVLLGKPDNESKLLRLFHILLQDQNEYDIKITYFLRFLLLSDTHQDKHTLQQIQSILEQKQDILEDRKSYVQCIIEYSKTRI